ncbi:MAG: response regulator [Armatimonadia bacterium]|nr:response regulator [Armatimonadia bacterium]
MAMRLLIVEDNPRLCEAMASGLQAVGDVEVVGALDRGEDVLPLCLDHSPDAILMDVQLEGEMTGIDAAIAVRRELPRLPIVFYSIQDDDDYYRRFRESGILSHYAYVRKSNYLLPAMVLPLLHDAIAGRSFVDPEIEERVHEVRTLDEQSPMALLEPTERDVALMLARGMTNEQIAASMGFRDKRTISRINGQIYAAWGLADTTTDEKVARTRAAIIVATGRMLSWDEEGTLLATDGRGEATEWEAPWTGR